MATERLSVILQMQASQYNSEARKAAKSTSTISNEAKAASGQTNSMGRQFVKTGSLIRGTAVAGGFFALKNAIGSAITEAERAASAVANTEQILRSTGGAANVTGDDISELSRRLGALTGVGDDVVREGANVLLTFKNLKNEVGEGNDVFDRAVGLMLDVGAVMGTDTSSAALQLGKALNDPVSQMGALSRAGLTFSEDQKQMIKDMAANNNLIGAQTLILGELESQLGGTAAASADASDKISDAFGEILEAGGTFLLPILEDVAIELQTIVGLTDELDRVAQLSGGAAESAAAFLTVATQETGNAGFISGFGKSVEEFILILTPGIDRVERFREEMEKLAQRLPEEELRAARDHVIEFGNEMGFTGEEVEILVGILDNQLAESLRSTGGGIRAINDQDLGDIQQEFIDTGLSADEAREATKLFEEQLRRLTSPAFKALDDQRKFNEAVAALEEARAKGDPEELQIAIEDAGQAYIDARESAAEFNRQDLDDAIGAMEATLLAAGATDEEVQLLTEHLRALDGGLSEYEIRALFTASGSAAAREAIESGGGFSQPTFTTVTQRQHGGPLRAGQLAIVGERGPELFRPNQSGTVIPNNQLATAVPAGPTIYVGTVYGFDDFSAKVRDAGINIARLGG